MPDFQISLQAARLNAGLTQKEVAQAMHVPRKTVDSWENGTLEPKISQGRQLSELFRIPIEYIFFTEQIK